MSSAQSRFARALLEGARAVPTGLKSGEGAAPERRFAVHRTNVAAGWTGGLASRFPATEMIVGPAFFAAMARSFAGLHPPRSPVLLDYGDDLPDFIDNFEPAAGLPYLADVARLEVARGRAYHAADAVPLDPAALAQVPPERLAGLTVTLHPAASILRSRYPIVTIWAMNAGEADLAPVEFRVGEDALVGRPELSVTVRRLPPGAAAFLSALGAGAPLGSALATAAAEAPDFDRAANIAGLFRAGLAIALR